MRPRRILGYARVSSELQGQGSSLRDQQATIAAYAKAQRHPDPTFYVESESAIHEKNERRERIRALMADVRPGDLVLCDKIDRWSRDPEFTYRSLREILAAGASFYAVGDQCDPSTPEGDTMLNFRVLFAKEEHKRIKARMVGTRKLLRDQGYYTEGLPPFGYRRALPKGHKGVEKNVLVVEPTQAEIVRRAYRLCIAGHSMTKICASLGIARDRVFASLRSRTYLGEIKNSRGEWIKGKHEAIVDADTFTKAQAALSARKNAGAQRGLRNEHVDPPRCRSVRPLRCENDLRLCGPAGSHEALLLSVLQAMPDEGAAGEHWGVHPGAAPRNRGRTAHP